MQLCTHMPGNDRESINCYGSLGDIIHLDTKINNSVKYGPHWWQSCFARYTCTYVCMYIYECTESQRMIIHKPLKYCLTYLKTHKKQENRDPNKETNCTWNSNCDVADSDNMHCYVFFMQGTSTCTYVYNVHVHAHVKCNNSPAWCIYNKAVACKKPGTQAW